MSSEADIESVATSTHTESKPKDEKTGSEGSASVFDVFSFGFGPRQKLFCFLGMLSSCISGTVFPALAFYFAKVFEELSADPTGGSFLDSIRVMAFTFMVLGAMVFVFMTLQTTFLETMAAEMTMAMKQEWFDSLLRQDMAYHDIKDISRAATIISSNGKKYQKGLGRKFGEGIQFTITFIGGFAYAFWVSWKTSLVTLAALPVMSLTTLFVTKANQSQTAVATKGYADAGSIVYNSVSGIRTILSLNAADIMIEKFKVGTETAYRKASSRSLIVGLANGGLMAGFLLSYMILTLYGTYLLYSAVRREGCDPSGVVPNNQTCAESGADVFGALMGITFAGAVLPQVSIAIESFAGARVACYPAILAIKRKLGSEPEEEQDKDSDKKPLPKYEIDSSSDTGKKPSSITGEIEFHDVHYTYPTRPDQSIFNGFSLKIESGKTVALVGPSGGGKSTVVQLIERFYDPKSGKVTLDNQDLKDLNVKWLREQIGLVSQEPCLFACSIKENIAYGSPNATMDEIIEAAKMANAHNFIMSFPEGYDTDVGDKGAQLSGGQKQRIAIARTLIKNPKILLLDEATSALDSESEFHVQEALDKLLQSSNRTTIVIAHRLSTIRDADMIAVVSGGKIAETGTHDELIKNKDSQYYQLVQAQNKGPESGGEIPRPASDGFLKDYAEVENDDGALIAFKDVKFTYPSRPENIIFDGLNLTVRKGETLALVGPSGGGKSTVIQLIERFYDPDSGVVSINGIPLPDVNVKSLRNEIGLVQQEPTLFATTIAENIAYGLPGATQAQIEEATKLANAHDFIMSFPDKYQTQVGERGTQISGGQKQRIAIARAILKKPSILLLDEATSALDSESEKVVQEALDNLMVASDFTVVVIAHRLSTIRNADRIAVIGDGKVKEIGTHDELMAKPKGTYRRLQNLQSLDSEARKEAKKRQSTKITIEDEKKEEEVEDTGKATTEKDIEKQNIARARAMAKGDILYLSIGAIGSIIAGVVFPAWGFIFAFMIEVLYVPVFGCDGDLPPPFMTSFDTCQEYLDDAADTLRRKSFYITYAWIGLMAATIIGNGLLFYGFGKSTEKLNKRIRDTAFIALIRQEISYFDVRSIGSITSQLQDDAAMIHSFSGEPIRSLFINLSSLLIGLICSFYYMWPFALLVLAIMPAMGFGAMMEMKMYFGEDESGEDDTKNSSGSIVIESLLNMRTVASLTMEKLRSSQYKEALSKESPGLIKTNFFKGAAVGLGQFCQQWGMALMFFWGGWLLNRFPDKYTFRGFMISMFALLFSLSGTAVAAQGITDRDKANAAALRIFNLVDRKSSIDPLSESGKKLK